MKKSNHFDIVRQDTKILYEKLINNSNIDGKIEYHESGITWEREGDIFLTFDSSCLEVYIGDKHFTHWHDPEYEELCKIGEKGNIMVVTRVLGLSFFYKGTKQEYIKKNGFVKKIGRKYFFGRLT